MRIDRCVFAVSKLRLAADRRTGGRFPVPPPTFSRDLAPVNWEVDRMKARCCSTPCPPLLTAREWRQSKKNHLALLKYRHAVAYGFRKREGVKTRKPFGLKPKSMPPLNAGGPVFYLLRAIKTRA